MFKPPFAKSRPDKNDTFILPYFMSYILTGLFIASDLFNREIHTGTSNGTSRPDGLLLLLQADNVTRAMHNVARYMTIAMYSNATAQLQQAQHNNTLVASEGSKQGIVYIQQQTVFLGWQ